MRHALAFHLKSKVFNNVESPLKAQSSSQPQRLSTMLGKLKAQLVPSTVCGGYGNLCVCVTKMQTQRCVCESMYAVVGYGEMK